MQNNTQNQIQNQKVNFHHQKQLLCGAISGALSRTAVAPIERIIILKQTKNPTYMNDSILQTLIKIVKNEGITALFKGNLPNCLRISPFQAIEFYTNDVYKRVFSQINLLNEKKTLNYMLSGALAGATATLFVYPLDLVKTVLAVNTYRNGINASMIGVAKNIIQKEGFLALYSGMKPTIFGMTPYASLKFTFFSSLKDFSQMFQVAKQYSVQTNLMCGSLAGCMAVSITYPTDLIRRRMQVSVMNGQSSGGIYQTFKSVVNQDGYKGLYTGLSATYLKIIPSTALVFAINEYLKQVMNVYQLH